MSNAVQPTQPAPPRPGIAQAQANDAFQGVLALFAHRATAHADSALDIADPIPSRAPDSSERPRRSPENAVPANGLTPAIDLAMPAPVRAPTAAAMEELVSPDETPTRTSTKQTAAARARTDRTASPDAQVRAHDTGSGRASPANRDQEPAAPQNATPTGAPAPRQVHAQAAAPTQPAAHAVGARVQASPDRAVTGVGGAGSSGASVGRDVSAGSAPSRGNAPTPAQTLLNRLRSFGERAHTSRDTQPRARDEVDTHAQVARGLAAALRQGSGTSVIRLTPEALGPLRIDLVARDSTLEVTLTPSTGEARALLERSLDMLRAAIEARGIADARLSLADPAEDAWVEQHDRQGGQEAGPAYDHDRPASRGEDSRGRSEATPGGAAGDEEGADAPVSDMGARPLGVVVRGSDGAARIIAIDALV